MNVQPILLIVDDIEDYLSSLERLLNKDYNVITARSLSEAKEKTSIEKLDIAIVDIRLSEEDVNNKDGLLLLKWMKEQYPDIPVIMMSAYKDFNSAVAALNHGAKHFLKKPINVSELQELLKKEIFEK